MQNLELSALKYLELSKNVLQHSNYFKLMKYLVN